MVLVGVTLAVVQVRHALRQSANSTAVAVDAVPLVAVAPALAYAGSHLADRGDGSVVMVSVTAESRPVEDENRQLL